MACHRRKLVVVGDNIKKGKTELLITFSKGKYPEVYVPTVFENCVADLLVDNEDVEFELVDTADQEDYDRLRPLSYPNTDVVLLVFYIDFPDSLDNVKEKWVPEIKHFCPDVPYILVGIRKELRNNPDVIAELAKLKLTPVTPEEGETVAQMIEAKCYMECSAKEFDGVNEVFETAARFALQHVRHPQQR